MNSQNFDSKYLENGDRYEVGPREHLHEGPTCFRLVPSPVTLDDSEGSKIKVKLLTSNM